MLEYENANKTDNGLNSIDKKISRIDERIQPIDKYIRSKLEKVVLKNFSNQIVYFHDTIPGSVQT